MSKIYITAIVDVDDTVPYRTILNLHDDVREAVKNLLNEHAEYDLFGIDCVTYGPKLDDPNG